MDLIELLRQLNISIDKFYWVRTAKFFLGFYLILMTVATILGIYRLWKIGYWKVLTVGHAMPKVEKGKFQKRWDAIMQRLETSDQPQWKISVIEASQMLEEVLSNINYPGEGLGVKLESMLPGQLPNLIQAREAVKVRNRIVQEDSFSLNQEEARQIVETFGNSLKFFEAIE